MAVKAVQVGQVGQQPEQAVPVVGDRRDLAVQQLQAPQVLQVLLQWDRVVRYLCAPGVRACVRARSHQCLQVSQLFDLVPAQVQVRQVWAFLGQLPRGSAQVVVAQVQLGDRTEPSADPEAQHKRVQRRGPLRLTLRSLGSEGTLASEPRATLTRLRDSSSQKSLVRPSRWPSAERQLSRISSRTWGGADKLQTALITKRDLCVCVRARTCNLL